MLIILFWIIVVSNTLLHARRLNQRVAKKSSQVVIQTQIREKSLYKFSKTGI